MHTPLPQWVNSEHPALKLQCPLYPRKRTFADAIKMSALGQKQTSHAPCPEKLIQRKLLGRLNVPIFRQR
jgi:hypothetical protein